MTAIQILLVVAALLWLARYLVHLRSGGATRVLAVLAAGAGILLVVFPELSSRLASLVGVTRGVDLMIYVTLVAFGFLWLHQAARIRELEARLVDLARKVALEEAPLAVPTPALPSRTSDRT